MTSHARSSEDVMRKILFTIFAIFLIFSTANAKILTVPDRYETIADAIDAANDGDTILVRPGVHTLPEPSGIYDPEDPESYLFEGLDFAGKNNITLTSMINPDDPDWSIVESTIIDIGGGEQPDRAVGLGFIAGMAVPKDAMDGVYAPFPAGTWVPFYSRRAFHFHSGSGDGIKIIGFTIRNGALAGAVGQYTNAQLVDFSVLDEEQTPAGTEYRWRVSSGTDAAGDGYGGAVLCEDGKSPTFRFCHFYNNTVLGGRGGNGADGQGFLTGETPAEWGGHGGHGTGIGYGGAVAVLSGANPAFDNCIFEGNVAKGGEGGHGGNGGDHLGNAQVGSGGDAGYAGGKTIEGVEYGVEPGQIDPNNAPKLPLDQTEVAEGYGGAIYIAHGCDPNINVCTFLRNDATHGRIGSPGTSGIGTNRGDEDFPTVAGRDEFLYPSLNEDDMTGGAVFFAGDPGAGSKQSVSLKNCQFEINRCYERIFDSDGGLFSLFKENNTDRAAVYLGDKLSMTMNSCRFLENPSGAILVKDLPNGQLDTDLTLQSCDFIANELQGTRGGAVFFNSSANLTITDCSFGGNFAPNDGGALWCSGTIVIQDSSFSENASQDGLGGAIFFRRPASVTIDMSSFIGNESVWGGALFMDQPGTANIDSSYFKNNIAQSAGAIYLLDSLSNTLDKCTFVENEAIGGDYYNLGGGAIVCSSAHLDLANSTFTLNKAKNEQGFGGAVNLFGGDDTNTFHQIHNCLFDRNHADKDGGAVISQYWTEPEITSCTFADNTAGEFGGALYQGWGDPATVKNSIFYRNSQYALYEENFGGQITSIYNLFFGNTPADFYKSETGGFAGDAPEAGSNNIVGSPKFVSGDLGGFYLDQAASAAVNNGQGDASLVFNSDFTTSPDNVPDTGTLDIGYHHLNPDALPKYTLTIQVNTQTLYGGFKVDGASTIYGPSNPFPPTQYPLGTFVEITAVPNAAFRVAYWTGGTLDDSSTKNENGVFMSSAKNIEVTFEQPDSIYVGPDSGIKDIQEGIDAAKDGDIVVVQSGIYNPEFTLVVDKSIRLTTDSPEHPERTIINGDAKDKPNQWIALEIRSSADENTVIEGFTFTDWNRRRVHGDDGDVPGENGESPGSIIAGIMRISENAKPVIRNCILQETRIRGGNGGTGANGDENNNAGRGGWGSPAYGGGVYIHRNAAPVFENVEFIDLQAVGGLGGNGGDKGHPDTLANYGGNWSVKGAINITSGTWYWVDGDLWAEWGFSGPPKLFTAYGGAVYCDQSSSPTFINCTFADNTTWGGRTGHGGAEDGGRLFPNFQYELPSFGGAVYCAENVNALFRDCTFENNVAVRPGHEAPPDQADAFWENPEYIDFYLGHGGSVCAEKKCILTFEDCTFNGNEASLGGAMYYNDECDVAMTNCRFEANQAFHGGAVQGLDSVSFFNATTFKSNRATLQPGSISEEVALEEDNVIFGQGGAVAMFGSPIDFVDCVFTENRATAQGGALYFKGSSSEEILESSLFNCLLENNFAGSLGGAISSSWFSQVSLESCTVADNGAYWNTGQGGGLAADLNSSISALDTIIWGNLAPNGSQLYIGDGIDVAPEPSAMALSYSDVQTQPDDDVVNQPNLTVAATGDASTLAGTILGEGITIVGDPVFVGAASASGTFKGGIAAGIGIEEGIILTTGTATDALGPNESDGTSTANGQPGDAQLDALLTSGVTTQDAVSLTFTFRSTGGDVFFNYVFASEEYNEFTNSPFNDVFAFFLDGENIALIPGTNIPVTINNVNGGNPFGLDASNEDLFNNNDLTDGGPFYPFEYDGFTQVFTAQALGLSPGTHTITLVIADASDQALDSAVFIQADSFSDTPTIPFGDPIYVDTHSSIQGFAENEQTKQWEPQGQNIDGNPEFVTGPLGGYYLGQESVDPNQVQSAAVDTGSMPSGFTGDYTTRTDNLPDISVVDMGFHYPTRGFELFEPCRRCDLIKIVGPMEDPTVIFDYDGIVNLHDLSILADYWMDPNTNCGPANDWCEGADLVSDINKRVDMLDLNYMIGCWLVQDTEAPSPDPSEWAQGGSPSSLTPTSVIMTAKPASDNWDNAVEYYFECTAGPDCMDSGWQESNTYENADLTQGEQYTYRVQTRDNAGNLTGWSSELSVVAGADTNPPLPLKAEFAILPNSSSLTSVAMEALEATDPEGNGVEYFFECVAGNCNSSGWQDSPIYEDTGLINGDSVSYAVRYRDKSPNQNEGDQSDWASVIVGADIDNMPPTPDPMTFSIQPAASDCDAISMSATTADDPSEPVEYFFENVTNLTDSGWISSPVWTQSGLAIGQTYEYRVKARDASGNETAFSDVASAIAGEGIDCLPPYPSNGVQGDAARFALGGGFPIRFFSQIQDSWIDTMTAQEATDESPVVYVFQCQGDGCTEAIAVEADTTYSIDVASQNFDNQYRVFYRDLSPRQNESAPSDWFSVLP